MRTITIVLLFYSIFISQCFATQQPALKLDLSTFEMPRNALYRSPEELTKEIQGRTVSNAHSGTVSLLSLRVFHDIPMAITNDGFAYLDGSWVVCHSATSQLQSTLYKVNRISASAPEEIIDVIGHSLGPFLSSIFPAPEDAKVQAIKSEVN